MREDAKETTLAGSGKALERLYEEALSPSAKLIGGFLASVTGLALRPASAVVWTAEECLSWLERRVKEILARVTDRSRIQQPSMQILIPAVRALQLVGDNEALATMMATLVASSMDSARADKADPNFVDVIMKLNADEARLLSAMRAHFDYPGAIIYGGGVGGSSHSLSTCPVPLGSKLEKPLQLATYYDTLQRLGLATRTSISFNLIVLETSSDPSARLRKCVKDLFGDRIEKKWLSGSESGLGKLFETPGFKGAKTVKATMVDSVRLTDFGVMFRSACVLGPNP